MHEIKHTLYLDRSPQEVWEYLTHPGLLELWLGPSDFQPIPGHKFRFIGQCGNDAYCEVLEVTPFTRLAYSWQKNSATDNNPFYSKVEWTLLPKDNGTELQLMHNGFTALEDLTAHENGWRSCLQQLSAMNDKSYTTTLEIAAPPQKVFQYINEVPKWWSNEFEGSSTKLHDEFVICHPGRHYSRQKLMELIPGKKIVWLVIESQLDWLEKDQQEWTGTKMVFDLSINGDNTTLHFTHEGLVPEKECYEKCRQGWDMVIKERLFNIITNTKS